MRKTIACLIAFYSCTIAVEPIFPNPNLIVEGIAELSDEMAEKSRLYTGFRPSSLASLHPKEEKMLIIKRAEEGSVPQVFQKEPDGQLSLLTNYSDIIAEASYQPIDGDYFVFSKDFSGNENHQNYRFDLKSGTVTLLTDGSSKNTMGAWSKDGKLMAYGSNRRNGKDMDFYLIDPKNPESNRQIKAFSEGDSWLVLDFSPDDRKLLVLKFMSFKSSALYELEIETGELKELFSSSEESIYIDFHACYSPDGKFVYLITDYSSDFKNLCRIELSSKKITPLTNDLGFEVEAFCLSDDCRQIAYITNENGISRLRLLKFGQGQIEDHCYEKLPTGLISKLSLTKDSKTLLFNFCSAKSPSEVFSFDLENEKLTQLTKTESLIDTDLFVEPELIFWPSFDGRMISGFLYLPKLGPGEEAAVQIDVHGGPEAQFRPGFLGINNYFINEMKIALLFPNIRGSTGYGKTFLSLADGKKRLDAYEDINALLDFLKTRNDIDPEKIMVSGGSYGGNVSLSAAWLYNEKIACTLSIVGISNFVSFLENTEARRRDFRRSVYGDERDPETRQFLESIAPLNNVEKIKKPIFIVQGLMDPRVPYSEALQMFNALKTNGIPVWFLTAKNEGHGFSKKENIDYFFYAKAKFMELYLLKKAE